MTPERLTQIRKEIDDADYDGYDTERSHELLDHIATLEAENHNLRFAVLTTQDTHQHEWEYDIHEETDSCKVCGVSARGWAEVVQIVARQVPIDDPQG